jgi:uncharacterized protein GlcG (DUF336 family)
VVDRAGDREWIMSGRQAPTSQSKARTAARLQRPTEELEDNINLGRTAFDYRIAALRAGVPTSVNAKSLALSALRV